MTIIFYYFFLFWISTNLHHSQTILAEGLSDAAFWISTNLHHSQTGVNRPEKNATFWISTNLHHSQTSARALFSVAWFWISTNLHHSQTLAEAEKLPHSFGYLRIYIILKRYFCWHRCCRCFGYLRIYIILKQNQSHLSVSRVFWISTNLHHSQTSNSKMKCHHLH